MVYEYNPIKWIGMSPLIAFAMWGAFRGLKKDYIRYKKLRRLKKEWKAQKF